jgi:DNA polymerase alpha subunit B
MSSSTVLNKENIKQLLNKSYRDSNARPTKKLKKKSKLSNAAASSSSIASASTAAISSDNNLSSEQKRSFKKVPLPSQLLSSLGATATATTTTSEEQERYPPKSTINTSIYPKWNTRKERGNVIVQLGDENLTFANTSLSHVAIEQIAGIPSNRNSQANFEKQIFTYMYDKLGKKGELQTDRVIDFGARIIEHYNLGYAQPLGIDDDSEALYAGRILNDTQDGGGRLMRNSILLEGLADTDTPNSKIVRIHLSDNISTTIFQGQVVIAKGIKQSIGTKETIKEAIQVTELYTGVPPEAMQLSDDAKLHLIAAAGPFTAYDNLNFEPLNDLLKVAEKEKPDVLLLIGPFIDSDHPFIENDTDLDDSFDDIFERQVIRKLLNYLQTSASRACKIILVPSLKDINHDFVYPQPAFNKKDWSAAVNNATTKELLSRIITVSNPSTFTVNSGISIGVTSVDVLSHMTEKEFTFNTRGINTITRRLETFLSQQSYFPFVGGSIDSLVPVDMTHAHKLAFVSQNDNRIPSILILPSSTLDPFCQVVQGTLVINPQILYDSMEETSGCYIQMLIEPRQHQQHQHQHQQVIKEDDDVEMQEVSAIINQEESITQEDISNNIIKVETGIAATTAQAAAAATTTTTTTDTTRTTKVVKSELVTDDIISSRVLVRLIRL